MAGGTTFHFVTGGIDEALAQARAAAAGKDVRVGGGVSVLRQCLQARLLDEAHIAIAPVLLGRGESCSRGSTCRRSAIGSRHMRRANTPRTW
jgi:dihydrofolate reductase